MKEIMGVKCVLIFSTKSTKTGQLNSNTRVQNLNFLQYFPLVAGTA